MFECVTYLYFCTLGGLANPRCKKQTHHNGSYTYFTYWVKTS